MTLAEFYEQWSARQVWETTTVRTMAQAMDCCTFADVALGQVRRSHVETWEQTLSATLAPATVRSRYSSVRALLRPSPTDYCDRPIRWRSPTSSPPPGDRMDPADDQAGA